MKNYVSKWGRNDPDIKKQLGLVYRYFIVFVENGKWRKLIRHPMLAALVIALRMLVGVLYIKSRVE
jgi:hypothetical protein